MKAYMIKITSPDGVVTMANLGRGIGSDPTMSAATNGMPETQVTFDRAVAEYALPPLQVQFSSSTVEIVEVNV